MVIEEPCHHRVRKGKVLLSRENHYEDKHIFFLPDEVIHHPCVISYAKVTKYLRQGCQGFLASLVEAQSKLKDLNPSLVMVVSKYLEVRLEELPSLPPARKMEFSIDLLIWTTPISKVPY